MKRWIATIMLYISAAAIFFLFSWSLVNFRSCVSHNANFFLFVELLFDLLSNKKETLFYVFIFLRTGLKEIDSNLICKLLALIKCDFPIAGVTFVANKNLYHIVWGVHFDLLYPVFYLLERLSVINGICHNDTHGSSIVRLSNCLKSLLSRRIPNLQPYPLIIDIDCFDFEVNSCISK